jgi:hypothetical protein
MFGASSMADTFFGSGNFLVAAKELGISAYRLDLEEQNCETAARAGEATTAGEVDLFRYPARGGLYSPRLLRRGRADHVRP